MTKTVSFSGDLQQEITSHKDANLGFKTWPRSSIKRRTVPSGRTTRTDDSCNEVQNGGDDLNTIISDVYHRFRGLGGIDIPTCLKNIVAGHSADKLKSYSVLNMLLKDVEEVNGHSETNLDADEVQKTLRAAITDFDAAYNSGDVRDTWTLQQIMRSMEQICVRTPTVSRQVSDNMTKLAQRCVKLVDEKPGSKTLLSPAIRFVNVALDRKLLPTAATLELIDALARSHFLFASSFITEAMLILSTIHKSNIDALNESEHTWIPLAVRALGSSSSLTRNLALQLIQYHATTMPMPDSPGLLASCLMQPSESHRSSSEPLYRVMVRKMASISALSLDDAKVMVHAWVAIIQSSFYAENEWALLDVWMDIVRVAFSKWPSTIPIAWETLINAQRIHLSYSRALVAPLVAIQYGDDSLTTVSKMIIEGVSAASDGCKTRASSKRPYNAQSFSCEIWDLVLEPALKSLASSRVTAALSGWAQLLERQTLVFTSADVPKYLETLSLLLKHVSQQSQNQLQQQINNFEMIWMNCIIAATESRQKVMDLVKFHYSSLSQLSGCENLALMFTNRLIAHLPPAILTERPKSSSFEYLTLILLPVVTFMSAQSDYLDRVLSSCKSEKTMKIMLRALLATIETGTDTQSNSKSSKWSLTAKTIKEYIGTNSDQESVKIVSDILLLFVPLMQKATAQQWQLWNLLLTTSRESQSRVLSQLKKLPPVGLQYVISLPRANFREEKIRIVKNSMNDEALAILQKQTDFDSDMMDSVARSLMSLNKYDSAKWAVKLLSSNRRFVIAKPMLQAIENSNDEKLIDLWNQQVEPFIKNCPAFVPKAQASRLSQEIPHLKIGSEIVIRPSAMKRPMETPPNSANAKRPRRPILTGSAQPALFTPPASDNNAEAGVGDDLCSSPPHRGSGSPSRSIPQTWKNSVDRARTLKRVMMGFDMEEAARGMKRSEQQMIYNLMFKSCVWLKTHLAETGPTLPEAEVKLAREELDRTVELHKSLQSQEAAMIENGRQRAQEEGDESFSEEEDLPSDELDLEDDDFVSEVKMEVA